MKNIVVEIIEFTGSKFIFIDKKGTFLNDLMFYDTVVRVALILRSLSTMKQKNQH